jgi:MOSC domain-containing protein YiiM
MHLLSVNIGQPLLLPEAKGATGIFKQPTTGPVRLTRLGLAGDAVCDTKNHGGPDQAVYIYGAPDYAWWAAELGRELAPGTFGENLTVADLESAALNIGDRLQVGEALLEVTAPRIPCVTLAARMGDPAFVKRFRAAERPGVYCRVLGEGAVRAGDAVALTPYAGETVSALEMFRDHFASKRSEAALRRYLAAPIDVRSRRDLEAELADLLQRG